MQMPTGPNEDGGTKTLQSPKSEEEEEEEEFICIQWILPTDSALDIVPGTMLWPTGPNEDGGT